MITSLIYTLSIVILIIPTLNTISFKNFTITNWIARIGGTRFFTRNTSQTFCYTTTHKKITIIISHCSCIIFAEIWFTCVSDTYKLITFRIQRITNCRITIILRTICTFIQTTFNSIKCTSLKESITLIWWCCNIIIITS